MRVVLAVFVLSLRFDNRIASVMSRTSIRCCDVVSKERFRSLEVATTLVTATCCLTDDFVEVYLEDLQRVFALSCIRMCVLNLITSYHAVYTAASA